jgi:hypothetical protein
MAARPAAWALGLPVLVTVSCTSLLGDGQYHVVQDTGSDDSGSGSGADSTTNDDSGSSGGADSGSSSGMGSGSSSGSGASGSGSGSGSGSSSGGCGACTTDSQCQSACLPVQGGTNCCDVASGVCFAVNQTTCPTPPDGGGSDAQCHAMAMLQCIQCCETNHAAGFKSFASYAFACACGGGYCTATDGGSGACTSQECSGASAAGATCDNCVSTTFGAGGPCQQQVDTSCQSMTTCDTYFACASSCP